ncbi:hypothetical protein C8D87_101801 [Lentzea atacamensis]|uniref:Uncharacterized protein n=1 Tax=Lentzea atacamensis TaxID=531938 RepID=A0ABX9EK18_9PSEU|nr:hypothetical protein C8D87_101801 [Lentzea atacamensis]
MPQQTKPGVPADAPQPAKPTAPPIPSQPAAPAALAAFPAPAAPRNVTPKTKPEPSNTESEAAPAPSDPVEQMLDLHGLEAVPVPGADERTSLANAIAMTLHPADPDARQALVNQVRGTPDDIARAADARVHALGVDGKFTSFGPVTGRPVHLVASEAPDGSTRYAATRESVHIGRPGVSYPGPTKLELNGAWHTLHRGEFEIETIAGRHHVRLYTAVVNPVDLSGDTAFKDIQQDPRSGELKFAKGKGSYLWAGAGRPLRAVQWLAKYAATDGGKPSNPKDPSSAPLRPVLRSYLVPLDVYNKITSGATIELGQGEAPSMNVDVRGESNQFGIGGEHYNQLMEHAEPGSLTTYPADSALPFDFPDQAGRIVPVSELYQRLGLDPDFRSDVLGKAYDPWLQWEKDGGAWKVGFLNNATKLHDMATQLREHHLTWMQSKQDPAGRVPLALIEPDADTFPTARRDAPPPKDTGFEARVERLNQFLNEVGPAATNVSKVTTDVLSTGGPALRDHLARTDAPAVNQEAFEKVLRENVVPKAAADAAKKIDGAVKNIRSSGLSSRADFHSLMKNGYRPKNSKLKVFADEVIGPVAAEFEAGVANHPDLALLDHDSRSEVARALGNRMRDELGRQFGELTDVLGELNRRKVPDKIDSQQLETLKQELGPLVAVAAAEGGGRKASWLGGNRVNAFGKLIGARIAHGELPSTSPRIDKNLVADVAEKQVLAKVTTKALNSFTGKDLAATQPDELRAVVRDEVLPELETATSAALKNDPALALVDQNFRDDVADAVAHDAKTRAERKLAGFEFDPVDPAAVDALMAKVPGIATQAEIGALMSADSDRMAIDFNTRKYGETPFPNSFHEWNQQRPAELARQRQAGDQLSRTIAGTRNPETAVKELIGQFPELGPKFDEVATQVQDKPFREPGAKGVYTFYEHSQMVLGQFLDLTANENPDTRFLPVDALAKAILFHDIEKVNAKNQFGDGQGRHDREPEHKLAVEMMDRYRGLWNNDREFKAARAIVDSDPFGFYLRNKITADETFKFLNDLTVKIDPDARPENAKKLFEEFHQYYQADFSSYTTHSTYVDRKGVDHHGPNSFTNRFETGPDGITKTPDGRHFEYTKDGRVSDAAAKMAALSDMFRDPATIREHRARLGNTSAPAPRTAPVELSFDFEPGATSLTAEQSAQVRTLAGSLVDAATTRADLGYLPPKAEVSGPHARTVSQLLTAQLGGLVDVQVVAGRQTGADVRVDWELKRPDGKTSPPPARTPSPARKVIDDESWRHSSAATADWFAPHDPASPDMWQNLRESAHARTVDTEIAGVTTYSTPSNISMYRTLVNYDLRRIEVRPGEFVQEYTVKVHLKPGAGVDPAVLDQVRANTHDGVNSLLNRGYRLPSGDQFHLNVEFTDNAADTHTTVEVKDVHSNQLEWNPTATPGVYAHEMLHYLGAPDEYVDATRVFLARESRSSMHTDDGGMMGTDLYLPDPALLPRHLWLIERIANSQVMVPDTRLDPPGTAPAPRTAPDAAATPSRPAPPAPPAPPATSAEPSTSAQPEPSSPPVSPARSDSSADFLPADDASLSDEDFVPATDASVAGQLPSFFQDSAALGTIAAVEVNGGPQIEQAVAGLLPQRVGVTPRGVDQIAPALSQNFESFLGNGRNFQIKVGKDWFEANVTATLGTSTTTDLTPKTKVDFTAQSGNTTTQTGTIGTAGDVGGAVTLGMAVGATGTVAGKAALARPVTSATTGTSTTDQRAIRSTDEAFGAQVPVTYRVTLTDARGNQVGAHVEVTQEVGLQIPGDLIAITPADPGLSETPWTRTPEHAAPEAVTDLDSAKAFEDIARQLHPSVTKLGAPGRTALQEFLSPSAIRDNLGAALNGWVVSPDLSSPHGSRGGVVRMRAVPVSVELVGTTSSANLRVHESAAISTGLSAATKSGFDASVTVGGGATAKGKVGGSATATVGYSARTTESSSAGTSASVKTGIQVKGELGLYRTKMRLEFQTPHGTTIPVTATGYLRAGLPEAGAANLPVPADATTDLVVPTPEPKFPPPYLTSAAAAGAVKVGSFEPAAEVQSQVEGALRGIPGFEKFLPSFADAASDPRKAGRNMQDLADQAENLRKLTTELSPAALQSQMDSLLGAGVQVQLKRQGMATNDFINVTVKARLTNPVHLGQAEQRNVRGSASTGPKLDSATTTQKGWSAGVEAKVVIPSGDKRTTATPTPSVGAKYTSTTAVKTSAGPTVGATRSTGGSPNAQLFQHDVTFDVEVTRFSRNRAWVKRLTPGSPWLKVPEPKTIAKTGVNLREISGQVNLWVSDGSTLSTDPAAFAPGTPSAPVAIPDPPTIQQLLTAPKPRAWPSLHVEAVANTEAVRDAAIAALNASGDTALTVPGTEARNRIDKLFSPESIKANLPTLVGKGMTEGGLKYGRRVADRVGAVGMAVGLSNPKLVSISDDVGVEAAHAGGFKAGESRTDSRSVDVTAGLNTPMRPTKGAVGSTALGATAKWTPWSKTKTTGTEATGSVDRNRVMPATGRTVLVQLDAEVTVVGESRASNTVRKGSTSVAGSVVTLPGGVFVRVSEDVARDMGVLPPVEAAVAPVEQGTMAPPSTLRPGESSALGLGLVEQAPDLSDLVPQLREKLGKLGKNLLPKSVLDDSMNNLRRLTDLTSDASVKALVDSALDGGIPLLVHDPGVFGKDTYQVTLKATPGEPVFQGAVNDGVDIEHTSTGTQVVTKTSGGGTGWGAGLKVPGSGLPKTGDANVSATVGGAAAVNVGQAQSYSSTESTTKQLGQTRAASGPAARYTVPVTFELVVEKGSKEIGRATSGQVGMAVRVHADNQKTTADPVPLTSHATTRPAEDGTPASAREWQETSAKLPPFASVENLRGAQLLQDAAVRALRGAGANTGITGKGTGAMNALRSGLALESLQPNLPGMLDGAFEVPGLREASLTTSQHARVKVYARLVNPRLEALSDGVAVSEARSTVGATSSEAKRTESHDVTVALAPGGVTSKKPDIGFSAAGAEIRHASEDSAAVSAGTTHNPATTLKTEGRTGLVGYDVEYRVVADLGKGRTGVVELKVPGSAQVRMHAADAETVLGRTLPDDLDAAQTGVHEAAKAWREAEVTADEARHAAQTTINDLAPQLAQATTDVTTRAAELAIAEQNVTDATTRLGAARQQRDEAVQALARAESAVDEAADLLRSNELNATLAEQMALAARLDVDQATAREQAARADSDQSEIRDAAEARQEAVREHQAAMATAARTAELAARARDLHSEAVVDLGTAQARAEASEGALRVAEEGLRQASLARDTARARHSEAVRAEQDLRAEIVRAEAEVERTRAEAARAQQAWWQAKEVVDQEVGRFNAVPASPEPSSPEAEPPPVPAASLPDLSLELPAGSTSLTFHQLVELERMAERLAGLQAARAAEGLPAPVVEITGDHAARVAELLSREIAVDITVAPGRPNAADLHVNLAPVNHAATADDQLSELVTTAMEDASPLMRSVHDVLASDPRRFVNSAAALHLLRASVVLHTRTAEVGDLIDRHGADAVADAFIRQFERPIIETAQREAFADLSTEPARNAFTTWAHQLWDTIENQPQLAADPDALADHVFHHDKGYNRATNFAQARILETLIPPPPLAEAVAGRGRPDNDPSAQAMWLFQVLADAKLIPADASVSPEQFTAAVNDNRAELAAGIGVELTDRLTAELREELQSYGMVDEDVPVSATDQLAELASSAMEHASPLMRSVESALWSNPQQYVHHEAGLHLLRASVVLDTRTDEVAGLIRELGVDAVADAFIQQFERPIIETAQREAFADLDSDAGRAAFGSWAHQLWDTINNTPQLTQDAEVLAGEIFNHDKGYNRATNFAQQVALAAITGPPPLSDAIAERPAPAGDTADQAAWVYQVFSTAGLIAADGTDTASGFTELVRRHRAELEPGLGRLDEQRIADLRQELVDMVMLDDDMDSAPASPPAPPDPTADTLRYLANDVLARPAPPPVTPNGLYAAVAYVTRGDAATLRKHVVNKAANDPNVARAATDFAAGRPMLPGHLNGALVENLNWSLRPSENENTSAGNARDLLGHLIASHLGVNVVIHQGGPPVVLAPLGGHSPSSVEVDLVVVNGQATYRPHT